MLSTRSLMLLLIAVSSVAACRRGVPTTATGTATAAETAAPDGGGEDLEQMYRDLAASQPNESNRWTCYGRQMGFAQHMGGPWGMGHRRGMHGPMHGTGMGMMAGWGVMADWHREMAAVHQQLAADASDAGNPASAARHAAIAAEHLRIAQEAAQTAAPPTFRGDAGASGAELFARACAPCHRENGQGVPGTFPPLQNNPIVAGDDERLIRILLDGMVGPLGVGQDTYYGVMPAFGAQLTDEQIARVLTYVRGAWGAQAPAVASSRVAEVRGKYAKQLRPWTTSELGLRPERP
ncbi:MAG TPA: c-type cytochrome [Polyangiaceae bacterium]|nr:c-type cytochrome [Polyangiaceae bacterium]